MYRASDSTNRKLRPAYYSKLTCFRNFLSAFRPIGTASMLLLYDGVPSDEWRALLPENARLERTNHLGNAQSFQRALELALRYDSDDLVYFVEDDYLHVPESLRKLLECYRTINPDYATLYDHPVRYTVFPDVEPDYPLSDYKTMTTLSHHWQCVESTCMTFAARVRTLQADRGILLDHTIGFHHPMDREIFRHLQGLGRYQASSPHRRLVGPVPSLATHCELPWLAPTIDWASLAGRSPGE